jgi:glutamine synthetase adenylyltransferase
MKTSNMTKRELLPDLMDDGHLSISGHETREELAEAYDFLRRSFHKCRGNIQPYGPEMTRVILSNARRNGSSYREQ